ncbi:hypothetical protein AB0I91_10285 [Actinosynnema sp. NPDC049800]
MAVRVASRRRGAAWLAKTHPGATVVDVTSKGPPPWVRLSPFFPHGGIPVPFTPEVTAQSVEGVWQALKVFEGEDVDRAKLDVKTMTGLKRTVRRSGPVRGHREGLAGERLLAYEDARRAIYLPTYRWVLEHRVADEVAQLKELSRRGEVVLLDYTTNGDVADLRTPLSHAALIAAHLEDRWP